MNLPAIPIGLVILCLLCITPPDAKAITCEVSTSAPTFTTGTAMMADSCDTAGNKRVTQGTLTSGEDQTNNLLMTSGGVVRTTTFSSVTSATTSAVTTVPIGAKSFYAQMS